MLTDTRTLKCFLFYCIPFIGPQVPCQWECLPFLMGFVVVIVIVFFPVSVTLPHHSSSQCLLISLAQFNLLYESKSGKQEWSSPSPALVLFRVSIEPVLLLTSFATFFLSRRFKNIASYLCQLSLPVAISLPECKQTDILKLNENLLIQVKMG